MKKLLFAIAVLLCSLSSHTAAQRLQARGQYYEFSILPKTSMEQSNYWAVDLAPSGITIYIGPQEYYKLKYKAIQTERLDGGFKVETYFIEDDELVEVAYLEGRPVRITWLFKPKNGRYKFIYTFQVKDYKY